MTSAGGIFETLVQWVAPVLFVLWAVLWVVIGCLLVRFRARLAGFLMLTGGLFSLLASCWWAYLMFTNYAVYDGGMTDFLEWVATASWVMEQLGHAFEVIGAFVLALSFRKVCRKVGELEEVFQSLSGNEVSGGA